MSENEKDPEIGLAFRELAKAEQNLACLEKTFSSFLSGMKVYWSAQNQAWRS